MTKHSQGFSAVEIMIVLVIVIAAIAGGWYVWMKSRKSDLNKPSETTKQSVDRQDDKRGQAVSDPYEGWRSYSNSKYGISFRYPSDWRVEEAGGDSSASPDDLAVAMFAANLKRNADVKYNNTLSVEVLNQNLEQAAKAYDKYFGQSTSNDVSKTTNSLKGKQGVQYVITNSDGTTKLYLFAIGDQTYEFTSINEWLNVQADASYWSKFDKTFASLEIN